jgi:tRNA(fMet)-specific endonuclease VapC
MTRRYLLDTNAASDMIYSRRGVPARAAAARRAGAVIGTCFPVVGELYFGAEHSKAPAANIVSVRRGLIGLRLWHFDLAAAVEYGRLAALLRRTGRPMQQIDIQIAAVALMLGRCTVVSTDTDLAAVPGLPVEVWAA